MQRREFLHLAGGSLVAGYLPDLQSLLPDWLQETKREETVEQAEDALDEIFEPLREAENSIEAAGEVATEVCDTYGEVKELDEEVIQEIRLADSAKSLPTEARHFLSSLEGVVEVFNNRFDVDIDSSLLESVDAVFKTAANLVPLVVSAKQVADSACEMAELPDGSPKEEKVSRRFLTNCAMLVVEVLMIEFSLGYRVSFWATRKAANILLVRMRGLVGLKVYALLLREVHWTVRENFADAVGDVVDYLIDITETLREDLPAMYDAIFEDDDLEQLRELRDESAEEVRELADRNVLDDGDSVGEGDDWSLGNVLQDDGDLFEGGIDLPL